MDKFIRIIAWWTLGLEWLLIVLYPILIGKPKRGEYTYLEFIGKLVGVAMVTLIGGRVLGWW